MLDDNGEVLAQSAAGTPKRYGIVFAGQAIGGDSWEKNRSMVAGERFTREGDFIVPQVTGPDYLLTLPLEPLSAMREDFSIVSNMAIPFSRNSVEAADVPQGGAFRDFHGGGAGPLLCGMRSDSPSFTCRGITSDQIVAGLHRGQTTIDSLVVRAQPSWYLSGSSYAGREFISYAEGGSPIESQTSPQVVFRSLFSNFAPDGDAEKAAHEFEIRARQGVLGLITEKRQRLLGKVGAADRMRLERHFDELNDLERRIASTPGMGGQCLVPTDPGEDPAIGGDNAGSGSSDIATNTGYSNEHDRARLLADLIHMAYVCDLTRVATLQVTTFQSHMNVHAITEAMGTPVLADLHEVGHNGDEQNRGQVPVSLCLQWHISHYAYLIDKMKNTPEGDGTLLDNSAIVFVPEAGHGLQLNDATSLDQTHSVEQMVMLVAGSAGGLSPGKHIDSQGAHPAQCLITAMQAAGYEGDTLGEVSGTIPDLNG
jgi:hypothetical protein